MASNDMGASPTDQGVIDAIATMLGTSESWSGADMLETIAELVGAVRPHPGNTRPEHFVELFAIVTGREAPAQWIDPDYDDTEYVDGVSQRETWPS